jgi:hypothetical protein
MEEVEAIEEVVAGDLTASETIKRQYGINETALAWAVFF